MREVLRESIEIIDIVGLRPSEYMDPVNGCTVGAVVVAWGGGMPPPSLPPLCGDAGPKQRGLGFSLLPDRDMTKSLYHTNST